jgi:signal transduction histidine kinase
VTEMASRTRTWLRSRVGAGVLIVLWAAAAIPLTLDAAHVVQTHTTTQLLGAPTDAVVVQVQEERRLSVGYLAGVLDRGALTAQRARTDQAYQRLQAALTGRIRRTAVGPQAARQGDELLRRLAGLARLRASADAGKADPGAVQTGYTDIVTAAFAGAPWLWPDRTTGTGSALLQLGRAREALSQQDATLLAASGTAKLDDAARARTAELAMTRRVLLAEAADRLPEQSRSGYRALAADPATGRLEAMENKLLAAAPNEQQAGGPGWSAVLDAYRNRLRAVEVSAVREAGRAAVPGAVATVVGAGVLAGLALAALVVALRRTVRGSTTPARPAPAAAIDGRPIGTEARMLELALHQNRRNQALLHRLLRLLDGVQRRVGDDTTLGELFRIDHLASRVRRNIEKTIALTGGVPGRRWTRPVPLVDVVRAAAAEVSGFERVSTAQIEPAALAGTAVTDVMHLLAELIENAVAFSPAETRVRVSGRYAAGHYRLAVADHGPGMPEDDLRTAAEVLASATPPATDAWDGLYAAGRLAAREGITVQLRNVGDVGLLAELSLPAAVLAGDAQPTAELPAVRLGASDGPADQAQPSAALAGVSADD